MLNTVNQITHNAAGNLTQLETANLIEAGLAIAYTYNFERLTDITYPQNPENNVKYVYGEAGASDNRAGRIVLQEDASGAQEFSYGEINPYLVLKSGGYTNTIILISSGLSVN